MAIFTAIAAAISAVGTFIGGLGAIGTFLLKTAVGIGLNLLAQAIAGKPKEPTFSINGTLQSGGDIARSFILGRTATAGSLVWVNTWGNTDDTPNAYLTQVIALSDLPGASLEELWVNGEKCTIDYDHPQAGGRGYPVNEYTKDGIANLWIKFYDGTQTTADSFLTGAASNGQRGWGATRVGLGVCYAIVTAKVTKHMFSGIPNFKFVLLGPPLYDPSRDTSVGGDGDQRWDTPATWGGDGDHLPAVQAYNLLRGLYYGGAWFYGLQGVGATRLPVDNWIAQINKCRGDGDTPVYRAGGEIPVDSPLATTMEALLTSCQGRLSEVGGTYSIFVGEPDDAIASFTDDDILSTEEQSFTPFFGLADTINGIAATYPSPDDGWSEKSAPPLYRTDLEALAGNRRLMADVSLAFVPYPEQVQRLMKSALAEGQRARRHTLVLPPQFWPYAVPGAILSWTSERNGYETKLFRVDGAADRANLDVMVDITEVDPSDYDWNSATDYQEPVDGTVGPPMRPTPQPIVDWSASADSVKDNDGINRRPAIRLAWDNTAGRLDDVIGIEFEVRLASTHETVYGGRTDQPEIGSLLISQGLLPLTQYEVRGRYIPGSDRETLWSGWLLVTTLDIRITDVTAYLDGVGQDVYATLQQLRADHDDLRARMEMIAAGAADATGSNVDLHTVAKRFQNATAVALREMTASIEDVDGQLTAQAAILDAVQVVIGEVSSGILWRMQSEAVTGGGDVVARVVLQLRATVGDDWVTAGTIWEAGFTGGDPGLPFSRITQYADQIVFIDSGGEFAPFVIESGQAWFNNARIKDLTAENITADKLDAMEVLQDGTLLTDLLAYNAVVDYGQMTHADTNFNSPSTWITVESVACANPNPSAVLIEYRLSVFASTTAAGSSRTWMRLIREDADSSTEVLDTTSVYTSANPSGANGGTGKQFMIDMNGSPGSTYHLQVMSELVSGTTYHSASGYAKFMWWKR